MFQAVDVTVSRLCEAHDAKRTHRFRCPHCLLEVTPRMGDVRAAHFKHTRPSSGCPEYYHGFSNDRQNGAARSRDQSLALWLSPMGNRWALYIEVPEVAESETSLFCDTEMLSSCLTVLRRQSDGLEQSIAVSELWPGGGTNTLLVAPSSVDATMHCQGPWPAGVDRDRWTRHLDALNVAWTVFGAEKGGDFRRYGGDRPLFWGQHTVVVRPQEIPPPQFLSAEALDPVKQAGTQWMAWRVALPAQKNDRVERWFQALGVQIRARTTTTRILTPASSYDESSVAVFTAATPIVTRTPSTASCLLVECDTAMATAEVSPGGGYVQISGARGVTQLRSDVPGDYVEMPVEWHDSVDPVSLPGFWWLVWDGQKIHPHTVHSWYLRDIAVAVDCSLDGVRFDAQCDSPTVPVPSLRRARTSELQRWLEHAAEIATVIEVDAGSLGAVRLEFSCRTSLHSDERPKVAHRRWHDMYALTGRQQVSVPHWRTATRTMMSRRDGWTL